MEHGIGECIFRGFYPCAQNVKEACKAESKHVKTVKKMYKIKSKVYRKQNEFTVGNPFIYRYRCQNLHSFYPQKKRKKNSNQRTKLGITLCIFIHIELGLQLGWYMKPVPRLWIDESHSHIIHTILTIPWLILKATYNSAYEIHM